jgi:hypothetical protein
MVTLAPLPARGPKPGEGYPGLDLRVSEEPARTAGPIHVPDHEMLNLEDSHPLSVRCAGVQVPGIGLGTKSSWGAGWIFRHPRRPKPDVKDGAGVILV